MTLLPLPASANFTSHGVHAMRMVRLLSTRAGCAGLKPGRMGGFVILFALICSAGFPQTYSTNFDGEETTLSEGGHWANHGLDWTPVRKGGGVAYGTQRGTETGKKRYNDSYAALSGFPPDQEAWGEVVIGKPDAACHQELEILLRWTSTPHSTTGYECFARCLDDKSSYLQIVRWDGPLGKFTYLADKRGKAYALRNGDTLKASIVGNVITVYVNGVEKARVTDDTFKTGNPGIGFFLACDNGRGIGSNGDFGFTSFTARGLSGERRDASPAKPAATSSAATPRSKK